jgi:hypothetical protein
MDVYRKIETYLSGEEAAALRAAVREGIELDLPDGVKKVIGYDILYIETLQSGQLTLDDLSPRIERIWKDNEDFLTRYYPLLDIGLAYWLNGRSRYIMDEFLAQDIKPDAKFRQSDAFPKLVRMAAEIIKAFPSGKLEDKESLAICQTVKSAFEAGIIKRP